jgi:hypothetical protein
LKCRINKELIRGEAQYIIEGRSARAGFWPTPYTYIHATTYTPDDGPCETKTCHVVVEEGHEIGVVEPGTAQRDALK